eukprot:3936429-Rhodomonas_salina.1
MLYDHRPPLLFIRVEQVRAKKKPKLYFPDLDDADASGAAKVKVEGFIRKGSEAAACQPLTRMNC